MLEIRQMTDNDIAAADIIAMRAYDSPSRNEELRRYLRLQPDGWFLAYRGDEALGLGGAIDYGPFAYIGLICVLPAAQRGGIGRAVMRHILTWLATRDCPLVLLDASAAGRPLYAQLGFVSDDASGVWTRTAPETVAMPIPAVAPAHSATPFTHAELAEVVAYDTPRFGADRTAVLADLLTTYPGRAALTRDHNGDITGFVIAQSRNLGPWVADDSAAAAALLTWALSLDAPPTGALAPAQNHQATALLTSAGFTQLRHLTRMRLGGAGPRDRSTHFGLASFTLG